MRRRTRPGTRPALRSLFSPACFGPAGVVDRQHRSRNGHRSRNRHADRCLWLRRSSRRSRWAPRDRGNNHQDDDRRPTLSSFLPRHIPIPLAAVLHRSCREVRPSEALCACQRPVASPFRGREGRDSLDRGISRPCEQSLEPGDRMSYARKPRSRHLGKGAALPWQSPGDRPQVTGALFFEPFAAWCRRRRRPTR